MREQKIALDKAIPCDEHVMLSAVTTRNVFGVEQDGTKVKYSFNVCTFCDRTLMQHFKDASDELQDFTEKDSFVPQYILAGYDEGWMIRDNVIITLENLSQLYWTPFEVDEKDYVLYRHFDENDNLLYIGTSANAFVRTGQHQRDSSWSKDICRISLERGFDSRKALLEAEREAIIAERPRYNKHHNGASG